MVMGVPLALISASTAGCGAGLDGRTDDAEVGLRLARHHAAGGVAQIGAVKTQANATDHVSDVLLGETRVGASRARGGAVDAVFDAAKTHLAIDGGWVWMRRDDLSNTHVDPLLSSAAARNGSQYAKPSNGLEPLTRSSSWGFSGRHGGVTTRRNRQDKPISRLQPPPLENFSASAPICPHAQPGDIGVPESRHKRR
jgi:hypothetical protein